jgi:hypothetical protein
MGGSFNALIPWLRILLGSVTACLFFGLSWLTVLWWRNHRKPFYGALSVLLAMAGVLSALIIHRYHTGWLALIGFCLLLCAASWALWKLQPSLRIPIAQIFLATVCIGIALPSALIWGTHRQSYASLLGQVHGINDTLTTAKTQLAEKAERLSAEQVIKDSIQGGLTAERMTDLQHLALANDLQSLIITDTSGRIIARAEGAEAHDSILEYYPWYITVLAGDSLHGISYGEHGGPLVVAAQPLTFDGAHLGGLLIGQDIGALLAAQKSGTALAVATSHGVTSFASHNQTEIQLFNAAAVDEALRTELATASREPRDFEFRSQLGQDTYRFVGMSESTLTPGQPIAFVTLDPDQTKRLSPILLGFACLLLTVILGALLPLLKRKGHHA